MLGVGVVWPAVGFPKDGLVCRPEREELNVRRMLWCLFILIPVLTLWSDRTYLTARLPYAHVASAYSP